MKRTVEIIRDDDLAFLVPCANLNRSVAVVEKTRRNRPHDETLSDKGVPVEFRLGPVKSRIDVIEREMRKLVRNRPIDQTSRFVDFDT